jgi:hypothetical protein
MIMDALMKLLHPKPVVEATVALGYRADAIPALGIMLLIGIILYAIPRTSLVGAIYLTGYLGGAVASNLRVGNPLASHVLFPVYIAIMLWAGLALVDAPVRALLLRRDNRSEPVASHSRVNAL